MKIRERRSLTIKDERGDIISSLTEFEVCDSNVPGECPPDKVKYLYELTDEYGGVHFDVSRRDVKEFAKDYTKQVWDKQKSLDDWKDLSEAEWGLSEEFVAEVVEKRPIDLNED